MRVRTQDDKITIEFGPEDQEALGTDAFAVVDWISSAVSALAALRTGHIEGDPAKDMPDLDIWGSLINDLEHGIGPRLEGIRAAIIRAHAAAGGSYGDLARALEVPRSTAQYKRDRITKSKPSRWENWATGGRRVRPSGSRIGDREHGTSRYGSTPGDRQRTPPPRPGA